MVKAVVVLLVDTAQGRFTLIESTPYVHQPRGSCVLTRFHRSQIRNCSGGTELHLLARLSTRVDLMLDAARSVLESLHPVFRKVEARDSCPFLGEAITVPGQYHLLKDCNDLQE